jgi:UDP-2,3-diacylglucosamine hydrolase
MRVWIFSDLHLTDPESPFFLSFLKALAEPVLPDDHVVLAGDIFDLLVGNSDFFRKKYAAFFQAIATLADRQVQLYYIEGNHDFHVRELFGPLKIDFEAEQVVLPVALANGQVKKIYIAHGDLVDQSDQRYLALRKVFRSTVVQKLAASVPGELIQKIGEFASRPLLQKQAELPENWPVEQRAKLRKIFRSFADYKHRQGFDYIILGHCHDLDEVQPFYWNMGYPSAHRQYLYYEAATDSMARRDFPSF